MDDKSGMKVNVSSVWKKRVRSEYQKLIQLKKFKRNDVIKSALIANRKEIEDAVESLKNKKQSIKPIENFPTDVPPQIIKKVF